MQTKGKSTFADVPNPQITYLLVAVPSKLWWIFFVSKRYFSWCTTRENLRPILHLLYTGVFETVTGNQHYYFFKTKIKNKTFELNLSSSWWYFITFRILKDKYKSKNILNFIHLSTIIPSLVLSLRLKAVLKHHYTSSVYLSLIHI